MQLFTQRLLSSEPKSRALSTSRAESSLLAYHRHRVRSRNSPYTRKTQNPRPYQVKASVLGEIFEVNEALFRQSLAFHFPRQLTPRPQKGYLNDLYRAQLRAADYQGGKKEEIGRRRYISSYSVPRKVSSSLLEL